MIAECSFQIGKATIYLLNRRRLRIERDLPEEEIVVIDNDRNMISFADFCQKFPLGKGELVRQMILLERMQPYF